VKSDMYKKRNLKDELVVKLRETEEDFDRDTARKKLNGLRTAYSRELKKITDNTKFGIGTDDICVPFLWYFDEFKQE